MNLSLAVIGVSGVGKTLFCINFAEYLGACSLSYTEAGGGRRGRGLLSTAGARRLMVGRGRCGSGVVRTFTVHRLLKPYGRLALIDTAALQQAEPLPRRERSRLRLTLQALERADFILMLLDLSCSDPAVREFSDRAGRYLADYCRRQGKIFFVAGNKADLLIKTPGKERFFAAGMDLPAISALTRAGFALLKEALLGASPAAASSSYKMVDQGHGDNSGEEGEEDIFRL